MNKVAMPAWDTEKNVVQSPHVVILGAGASLASFPRGERRGRKLPLMKDFVETVGLQELLKKESIDFENKNFEDIFDGLVKSPIHSKLIQDIKTIIYDYFSRMEISYDATVYDKLILSLRKKDLIATFNWDPLLLQTYHRISRYVRELPQLAFLHGNVGEGICYKDKIKGIIGNYCSKCGKEFQPTELLYPIKDKDYDSDPSIKDDWTILRNFLRYAYFVTIFGYSAPKTDILAINIMKEIWNVNPSKELAEIEIITRNAKSREDEIIEQWKDFIVSHHYQLADNFDESSLGQFPRRSCEALAQRTLMASFIESQPTQHISEVEKLVNSLRHLVNEEIEYEKTKKPYSKLPYA